MKITQTRSTPDFFDFASPSLTGQGDELVPLFSCSSASDAGCGSITITPDAVYLGENDTITRINTVDIRSWSSRGRGNLFTLTVETDGAHVTYPFAHFRHATVTAMTTTIGPEHTQLRAA